MNLRGKTALICGGARIGDVVAVELARMGCHVILTYNRSRKNALQTQKKVRNFGVKCISIKLDVTNEKQIQSVLIKIKKSFGRLDLLVNMASLYEAKIYSQVRSKDMERMWKIHVSGTSLMIQYATRYFRTTLSRIVNFADWVVASGRPRYKNFLPYYTAKMGIVGLTEALALELAPRVLVNCIAPGPILPPENLKNEETKSIVRVTPLKKWGGALEIAKTVVFLSETNFITGECIRVDGGRHLL